MAIIQTITDPHYFSEWVAKQKNSGDSYGNCFSYEGANALQEYLSTLNEEFDQDIEFDPIAWCCQYTEYESIKEAYKEHYGDDSDLPREQCRTTYEQQLEYFNDYTTIIEFDTGVIVQDF